MKLSIIALLVVLSGCATITPIDLMPVGGSRADGTIKLGFEHGAHQIPKLDSNQAIIEATRGCRAWGYGGATPFGIAHRQCTSPSSFGCLRYFVTQTYQCTNAQ